MVSSRSKKCPQDLIELLQMFGNEEAEPEWTDIGEFNVRMGLLTDLIEQIDFLDNVRVEQEVFFRDLEEEGRRQYLAVGGVKTGLTTAGAVFFGFTCSPLFIVGLIGEAVVGLSSLATVGGDMISNRIRRKQMIAELDKSKPFESRIEELTNELSEYVKVLEDVFKLPKSVAAVTAMRMSLGDDIVTALMWIQTRIEKELNMSIKKLMEDFTIDDIVSGVFLVGGGGRLATVFGTLIDAAEVLTAGGVRGAIAVGRTGTVTTGLIVGRVLSGIGLAFNIGDVVYSWVRGDVVQRTAATVKNEINENLVLMRREKSRLQRIYEEHDYTRY